MSSINARLQRSTVLEIQYGDCLQDSICYLHGLSMNYEFQERDFVIGSMTQDNKTVAGIVSMYSQEPSS